MISISSKTSFLIISFLTILFLISGSVGAQEINLRLSHTGALDHHYQEGALMFKHIVSGMSEGRINIEVYPMDQLGSQRESVEGAQLGTVDMVLTSDVLLSTFEESLGVLNLPYLFSDYNDVAKVLDGEIGDELSERLSQKGLVVLSYWENGFRGITNSERPIEEPKDLEGLKIRTPSGEVFVRTFNTYGANATPMSLGDVYSALQVGTIDGQENPPAHALHRKFHEVQDYYSITNHIHVAEPLIISQITWSELSKEDKEILSTASAQVALWMRQKVENQDAEQIRILEEKHGMEINEANIEAFIEASQPVYDHFESQFGDLIERIQEAL